MKSTTLTRSNNSLSNNRALDGWLLIAGGLGIGLVLWLTPLAGASSRNDEARARHDFDSLVHAVSERYQVHGKSVPMMWLANICASRFTHGGVHGIKVVEFEDASRITETTTDPAGFGNLIKVQLGDRWSPMVRDHQKNEDSFVYVQNADDAKFTRLIVVDLDKNELDMVSVSLNPDQLAKWMDEHDAKDKGNRSVVGDQGSE